MRKVWFLLILVSFLLFIGCASLNKARSNYDACLADADCMAKMQNTKVVSSHVVSHAVSGVTGNTTVADTLGCIAGGLASMLVGMIYGRKVRSKKEV